MGVQISDIIPKKEIDISDLAGKRVAIDAFNALYQFLTTIRQQDGTPLMDSSGKITSHLSGLFYRNINLLSEGISLIYVFDGEPPELKLEELERRKEAKKLAEEKYEIAKQEEDEENMRKYASRTVRITDDIIEESKELLLALGIPIVQAKSEGEAEASYIAKNKFAWASASQDYDSILFGAPRLVRNLTLSRKRKTPSGDIVDVPIELIEFESILNKLQINQEQLISLAILVGTDYNPGGVRGIGQKRALEIVQKYQYPVEIFKFVTDSGKYEIDFDWREIFQQFKNFTPETRKEIEDIEIDEEKIIEILVNRHDFSKERIENGLEKLRTIKENKKQKKLSEYW